MQFHHEEDRMSNAHYNTQQYLSKMFLLSGFSPQHCLFHG
uniref:Uncharacterized protein n=1 Tax=Lotus japonicus TaxID=34305 RepID=I3SUT1_LOTJA|nr:unknown [Lotus japonicus]